MYDLEVYLCFLLWCDGSICHVLTYHTWIELSRSDINGIGLSRFDITIESGATFWCTNSLSLGFIRVPTTCDKCEIIEACVIQNCICSMSCMIILLRCN